MKLSVEAWAVVSKIFNKIKKHPFIKELGMGTLAQDKFDCYSEQDKIYSQHHKVCCSVLGQKVPFEHQAFFLESAQETMTLDQQVNKLYTKTMLDTSSRHMSPSLFHHMHHLHHLCKAEPASVGMAGLFPCYRVYLEVGFHLASFKRSHRGPHPFDHWIERYSSIKYRESVEEATHVFDSLAEKTTHLNKQKMLREFYGSTCFELNFWDDSYYKRKFGRIYLPRSKTTVNRVHLHLS